MANAKPLAGRKVLVTRPEAQAGALAELIAAQGGEPLLFPALAIEPVPVRDWPQLDLQQFNWLIFVSRNAVAAFVAGHRQRLPTGLKLVAVGDGTAQAMQQAGLQVNLRPPESKGSDSLLTVASLQQMHGQKVLIVRAAGGREQLAEVLSQRGAQVRYLEVYRRVLPKTSAAVCALAAQADYLLATSVASLDNLTQLLASYMAALKRRPLIVLSERIRQHALSIGFTQVTVTVDASDNAIMQRLMEMEADHGKSQPNRI